MLYIYIPAITQLKFYCLQIKANVYAKDINCYKIEKSVTYYEQDLTSSVLDQQTFFVVTNSAIENNLLDNLLFGVKTGGFLLTVENYFDPKFTHIGVDVVARYSDGQSFYVLLKKVILF